MQKRINHPFALRIHVFSSIIAMLTILVFWTSTVLVELLGPPDSIMALKRLIPWGLFLLVPAMAASGISGSRLAGGRTAGLFGKKLRRMKIIAANGALVLVPSALFLAQKASVGELDWVFYAAQAVELAAGAVNLLLMGQNAYDGFKLSGRRSLPRNSAAPRLPYDNRATCKLWPHGHVGLFLLCLRWRQRRRCTRRRR